MRATSQFLSKSAKYGQLQLKHWPCNTKLVKLYDSPETRILGQERSIYLWMEKNYPDTFRIVILNLILDFGHKFQAIEILNQRLD